MKPKTQIIYLLLKWILNMNIKLTINLHPQSQKKFKFMKMRVLIKVMAKTILQKMNQTFIAHM